MKIERLHFIINIYIVAQIQLLKTFLLKYQSHNFNFFVFSNAKNILKLFFSQIFTIKLIVVSSKQINLITSRITTKKTQLYRKKKTREFKSNDVRKLKTYHDRKKNIFNTSQLIVINYLI